MRKFGVGKILDHELSILSVIVYASILAVLSLIGYLWEKVRKPLKRPFLGTKPT